jgi:hypothetical protein
VAFIRVASAASHDPRFAVSINLHRQCPPTARALDKGGPPSPARVECWPPVLPTRHETRGGVPPTPPSTGCDDGPLSCSAALRRRHRESGASSSGSMYGAGGTAARETQQTSVPAIRCGRLAASRCLTAPISMPWATRQHRRCSIASTADAIQVAVRVVVARADQPVGLRRWFGGDSRSSTIIRWAWGFTVRRLRPCLLPLPW